MTYNDPSRANVPPNEPLRNNVPPGEYRENYTPRPDVVPAQPIVARVDYHDRVRWGPIFAGIVITLAAQLILSALGVTIGFTVGATGTNAGTVGVGIGIWAIISLLVSLFIGAWIMASTCGPMNNKTSMLNGAILWAATLAISGWLLASGVTGAFGIVASNTGEVLNQVQEPGGLSLPDPSSVDAPDVSPTEAQTYAADGAKASGGFLFGALLGLVASLFGATAGARKPRVQETNYGNQRVVS
ncbi:MAG: hypothetical protein AAFW95_01460 [Cyanobacteria bacterium J06638_6]